MSTRSADGSATSDALRKRAAETRLLIPPRLHAAHDLVCDRACTTDAEALLLTGSTVRGSRTSISDLDYHIIGVAIPHDDLPADLDIHVVSSAAFRIRLEEGDDFTQWSLRFGRVIFDYGIVRDSLRLIERLGLWLEELAEFLYVAQRLVERKASPTASRTRLHAA